MPIKIFGLSKALTSFAYANIITNGNFLDTNGWTESNATISASENVLSITANGMSTAPLSSQEIVPTILANKKYYIACRAKVTSGSCSAIRIRCTATAGTAINVASVTTPTRDVIYALSGIMPITNQTGALRVQFPHYYADNATANGKVMQVQEAFAVDLTELFGAGNEPEVADCDNIFKFVDGTKQPNLSKSIVA